MDSKWRNRWYQITRYNNTTTEWRKKEQNVTSWKQVPRRHQELTEILGRTTVRESILFGKKEQCQYRRTGIKLLLVLAFLEVYYWRLKNFESAFNGNKKPVRSSKWYEFEGTINCNRRKLTRKTHCKTTAESFTNRKQHYTKTAPPAGTQKKWNY